MKHLAIVPARGGSKRLLNKNLQMLDGKPLVQHTLEAVVRAGIFETILLSSDDDAILAVADKVEGVEPEKRDEALARDTTKVLQLIVQIACREGYDEIYDSIGYFLPTCPFRRPHHIREAYELLEGDCDSVIGITPMNDPIQLSLGMDEETKVLNPEAVLSPSPLVTGETRSQDFTTYYRPNGSFYLSRISSVRKYENFFRGTVRGYVIDRLHSVDIDTETDLKYAQFLLENGDLNLKED